MGTIFEPTTGGIYAITFTAGANKWTYIGSTKSFKTRWAQHRRQLRNGDHHAPALQRVYEELGEEAMQFIVLEHEANFAEGETLESRENFYLDTVKRLMPRSSITNTRLTAQPLKGRVSEGATVRLTYRVSSTSSFRGVSFEAYSQSWRTQVTRSGRPTTIGRFTSEIDAALAYDAWVRENVGPDAITNLPLAGEVMQPWQREALDEYYAKQVEELLAA